MALLQLCLLICAVVTVVYVSQSGVAGQVVLGTTACTTDANCSGVAHAKCDTKLCKCADSYKQANTTTCILNGIHDACTTAKDCSSANHLTCTSSFCACAAAYKPGGGKCIPKGVNDTCTAAADCLTANHLTCDTTTHKCQCTAGYTPGGGKCQKESSAVSFKITLSSLGIILMLNVILKMF